MGCRTDLTGRQPHRRSWRIAASAVFRPHRYCPSTNLRYWSAFWCRLYRRLTCSPPIDEVVIFPHSSQPVTEMGPITTDARSPVRNCRAALVSVPFPWLRRLTARGARRKTTEARYIPWNFPLYFSPCSFPRKLLLLPPNTSLVHFSFSELLSVRVTVSLSLVWLSLYHDGLPLL